MFVSMRLGVYCARVCLRACLCVRAMLSSAHAVFLSHHIPLAVSPSMPTSSAHAIANTACKIPARTSKPRSTSTVQKPHELLARLATESVHQRNRRHNSTRRRRGGRDTVGGNNAARQWRFNPAARGHHPPAQALEVARGLQPRHPPASEGRTQLAPFPSPMTTRFRGVFLTSGSRDAS